MTSYLGRTELPLGLRNNNPGNLVLTNIGWLGKVPNDQNTDRHFEQFTSIEYGLRAMAMDLRTDIRKGQNTITRLVYEYAPPTENDTQAYIAYVEKNTGINRDQTITPDFATLKKLIRAKTTFENGAQYAGYISDKMIEDGLRMAKITEIATKGGNILALLFIGWVSWEMIK